MSGEQVKTITPIANNLSLAEARRRIAACAIDRGVRLSLEERPSRLSTKLDVTVSGHPGRIREFHDDVRGDGWTADSSDLVGSLATGVLVEGIRTAKRRWQGRHDPPLPDDAGGSRPGAARTTVYWKWEDAGPDGQGVGPVWIETYAQGQTKPVKSEEWPQWARRSEAVAYAEEHGFVFLPDE